MKKAFSPQVVVHELKKIGILKNKKTKVAIVTKKKVIVKKEKKTVDKKQRELNLKRELFCQLYVNNRELFGNATKCYAEAYQYELDMLSTERPATKYKTIKEVDQETGEVMETEVACEWGKSEYELAINVCAVEGARLLRSDQVNAKVDELLLALSTEDVVDKELMWIMAQREELTPKLGAIKEFNAVRGRVKQKVEHRHQLVGIVKHFYNQVDDVEKELYEKSKPSIRE